MTLSIFFRHKFLALGLTLFLSALFSTQLNAAPALIDRVAVVVEEDIIMESEVTNRVRVIVRNLKNRNQPVPPAENLVREVVEQMIIESIQLQIGRRAGVRIDDTRLNQAMVRIAQQNGLSLEAFRAALEAEGASYQETREQIRREMITTRVREGRVGSRIQITEQEIQNYLDSKEGKARMEADVRLSHILLRLPENASDEMKAKQQQAAQALFERIQQGENFEALAKELGDEKAGDMGWRKETQLPSLFKAAASDLNIGETAAPIEASNGFHLIKLAEKRGGDVIMVPQTRVRHILIKTSEIRNDEQAQELLRKFKARIESGEDFGDIATRFSDDTGTLADGGDLGWMTGQELVPNFRNAMDAAKVGEITEPFQSKFGWHILQVTERRQENMADSIQRRAAREQIFRRKFDDEVELWLREERANAFVDIKIY